MSRHREHSTVTPPDTRTHVRSMSVAGALLVVAAAIGFGTTPVLARLAFEGGTDPFTLVLFRYLVGAVILLPLAGRQRLAGAFRTAGVPITLLLGVTITLAAVSYMSSVLFVPVGVAVIVFYLYPIMVAVLARIVDGSTLTRARIIALGGAVVGVALTASNDVGGLDWRGVALAALGAASLATYIVAGARLVRRVGTIAFTALSFTTATIMLSLIAIAVGISMPAGVTGWVGLWGATFAHIAAALLFFKAITLIEPAPASIIANVEPVWAIVFAWMLLGEMLGPLQAAGGMLVIAAVVLASLPARGRRTPERIPAEGGR